MQSPIDPDSLPTERPPSWPYCGSECAQSKTLTHRANGGMDIQVVHKPIRGVTVDMVKWWFNGNVDGRMVHPVNGKTYSRYLVWHPRDHIDQSTLSPGPIPNNATRAVWNIGECYLLTGLVQQRRVCFPGCCGDGRRIALHSFRMLAGCIALQCSSSDD